MYHTSQNVREHPAAQAQQRRLHKSLLRISEELSLQRKGLLPSKANPLRKPKHGRRVLRHSTRRESTTSSRWAFPQNPLQCLTQLVNKLQQGSLCEDEDVPQSRRQVPLSRLGEASISPRMSDPLLPPMLSHHELLRPSTLPLHRRKGPQDNQEIQPPQSGAVAAVLLSRRSRSLSPKSWSPEPWDPAELRPGDHRRREDIRIEHDVTQADAR